MEAGGGGANLAEEGNVEGGGGHSCTTCKYWRPHIHYPFIGFCDLHGRLTMEDDACERWEGIKILRGEFYWCSTCKTRLIGEEAAILAGKGQKVHRGAYLDPDVREELYSVF